MGVADSARRRGDVLGDPQVLRGVGARATAGAGVRRHPLGRAHVPRPASSTSLTGRAARRSCCCAWRAPTCLDGRPSWGGGKLNAATVSLEPLTDDQAGGPDREPRRRDRGPARRRRPRSCGPAEGNPLFVEEMLAMLIDDGLLVRKDGGWTRGRRPVRGRRPANDPRAAGCAARPPVAGGARGARGGRGDRQGVLRGRGARPGPRDARGASGRPAVARPQGADPAEPTTLPGEDAFRFRHLLIRDAAYEAIPKARRAELHERFADWLERVAGEAVAKRRRSSRTT